MARRLRETYLAWTEREQDAPRTGRRLASTLFGFASWPLSGIYRLGVAIHRAVGRHTPHDALKQCTLAVVASPLVGGTGKTPLVADLAKRALTRGRRVAIVVRGYARNVKSDEILTASAAGTSIDRVGDEAVVLAQQCGVPVLVGADPDAAIRFALVQHTPDLILLDDGVRHRWTGERRIIAVTDSDLDRPLDYVPYGRWRMPPRYALPASGVAVVTHPSTDLGEEQLAEHRRRLLAWGYDLPTGWYQVRAHAIARWADNEFRNEDRTNLSPPVLFCGIGQPSRFLSQVRYLGYQPPSVHRFADHHPYTRKDIEEMIGEARRLGSEWLLTTHKDAVKIPSEWLDGFPLFVLRISLELAAGEDMLSVILEPSA